MPRSALLALLVERPSSAPASASVAAPGAAAPRPRVRGPVVGRRPLVEAAVAALVVTLLYVVLRPDPVRTFGAMYDDAVYVSLGRAVALGHGYRSDHLVGAPVHEKFPPGLPAVYALLWRLGGTLEATLRLALMASIAAVGAAGGLVWYYSRRVLANGVTTSAVLALQPLLFLRSLRYFSGAASEPWFLLCWAAALVLAWRITERADSRRIAFAVALGLVLAAATLVRTQGVVLLPAVLIALLAARVPRAAVGAVLAAALVPLAAWRLALARMVATGPVASQPDQVAYSSWIPHGSVGEFAAFVGRVLAVNVPGYVDTAVDVVAGWNSPRARVLLAVVALLTTVGAVRALRRRPELPLTLGANAAVILLWPYLQDRFLVALMPFIGLAAAFGLEGLLALPAVARIRGARAAVLTLIVGASIHLAEPLAGAIARGASGGSATDDVVFARIFQARSAEVTEWVRVHTPADARVMTELGGAIYLRTGRVTVIGVPEEPFTGPTVLLPAGRYLAERLLADGVTHVVAWAHMGRVLMAQVDAVQRACPGVLEQLPPYPPDGTRSPARYFRVASGGEACLRSFIARTGGATDGGTAGASQAMASTDADPR